MKICRLIIFVLFAIGLTQTVRALSTGEWQFSVRVGNDPQRRAYLWVPDKCTHVRGVLIGVQNMLEEPMFEDPAIRAACADENLGIVWITPHDDFGAKNTFQSFNPPPQVVAGVKDILARLAVESGYSEIKNAPLLPVCHSAATPFGFGIANAFGPSRVFAFLPMKGWLMGLPPGIPTLHLGCEYAEVGGTNWGEMYFRNDRPGIQKLRANPGNLIGEFSDMGAGHFEWDPAAAKIVALFIRKAAEARLPENPPLTGPVKLKTVPADSGWLVDPLALGTRNFHPVPAKSFSGNPSTMFWYLDRELAVVVNDFMSGALAKKPQMIDFLDGHGQPLPLVNGGVPDFHPKFLDDGVTFQIAATFLDRSPTPKLYGGQPLGHADGPIFFKAGEGAIKRTGSNTFRVWMGRGSPLAQGPPWAPHVIAWQPGDDECRRCDRPGHPLVETVNKNGKSQTIDFPKIENQPAGVKSLLLRATSDAGLPVQFYVVSGPVKLADDNRTLEFLPVPPRAKFPVRVVIGVFQWGRVTGEKVKTAGPVFREFFITDGKDSQ
ncbi:MAG TPA: hypothetical protein VFV23_13075 [Verrucomicrobiae bacterium]|nr:hypothetical protein [Verrucomicrobiae bacterium]